MKLQSCKLRWILAVVVAAAVSLEAADCNRNGIEDDAELVEEEREFLEAVSYPLSELPRAEDLYFPVPADFNLDGLDDLVVFSHKSAGVVPLKPRKDDAIVLLSGADRTSTRASYTVGALPWDPVAVDLNGDAYPDIATVNHASKDISIIFNLGDGTFGVAATMADREELFDGRLLAADLDGNGVSDLAMVAGGSFSPNEVQVFLNRGNGTFEAPGVYGSPVSILYAADMNSDGDLDLVATDEDELWIRHNEGTGVFGRLVVLQLGGIASEPVIADLSGDGHADIARADHSSESVHVAMNSGNDSFLGAVSYPSGGYPRTALASDLDLDGRPELIIVSGDSLSTLENRGDGTFREPLTTSLGFYCEFPDFAAADLSGDGRLDLTLLECDWPRRGRVRGSTSHILLGRADGTFQHGGIGPQGEHPVIADLDGNGRKDLANLDARAQAVGVLFDAGGGALARQPARRGPTAVLAADFDADGRLDLATANYLSNDVSLFVQEDEAFPQSSSFAAGSGPHALAAADVNTDGKLDLLVASYDSGDVSVLIQETGAAFAGAVNYRVGDGPLRLAATDLDGDGKPDVVAANERSGDIAVLRNTRNGVFRDVVPYAAGLEPESLVVADLDGNGRADLAAANVGSNDVAVLLDRGGGDFAAAVRHRVGAEPHSLAATDLDRDGQPDLLASSRVSGSVSALLNGGRGTFRDAVEYAAGIEPQTLIASDLSGDGAVDAVVASRVSGEVSVLRNTGNGAFASAVGYPAGGEPESLVIADMDGDAAFDVLAVSPGRGEVDLLPNRGGGILAPPTTLFQAGEDPVHCIVADLNSDGRADLISANRGSDDVTVFMNRRENTFPMTTEHPIASGSGSGPFSLAIAELNGDGKPDFVTTNWESNDISVVLNRGDGTFGLPLSYPAGIEPRPLVAADLNGDGRVDLATADMGSKTVSLFMNDSSGTFVTRGACRVGSEPESLWAADLDGDGRIDLVTGNAASGDISVLLNRENGVFRRAARYEVGDRLCSLVVADFTGDGAPELAAATGCAGYTPSGIVVLHNRGDGSFGDRREYPIPDDEASSDRLLAADWSGDGLADLAVTYRGEHGTDLDIFHNQGDGTFGSRIGVTFTDLEDFTDPLAADFDGDGSMDIAVSDYDEVWLLFNRGGGNFEERREYYSWWAQGGLPTLQTSDLNGDGHMDLAGASGQAAWVFLHPFKRLEYHLVGGDPESIQAADLDGDGRTDLATANHESNDISVLINSPHRAASSTDLNANSIPDECDAGAFRRGDTNGDARADLTDAVLVLEHLFRGGGPPPCANAADVNTDAKIDLSDPISLLRFLFLGGPPPGAPGPPPAACGLGPVDSVDLGCVDYSGCIPW